MTTHWMTIFALSSPLSPIQAIDIYQSFKCNLLYVEVFLVLVRHASNIMSVKKKIRYGIECLAMDAHSKMYLSTPLWPNQVIHIYLSFNYNLLYVKCLYVLH